MENTSNVLNGKLNSTTILRGHGKQIKTQWVEWYVWKKKRCGATPQKQKGKVAKIIKWWKM